MRRDLMIQRVEAVPGLVAAYLFGSRARGDSTSSSDVDLAILFERAPETFAAYPFDLADDLARTLGHKVDVVVLNRAPSDLVHRVLRDGELLIEHDRSARIA